MINDPEMRRAALADGPKSQTNSHTEDCKSEALDIQARTLCRQFALDYHFATTVAQLAWGVSQ
jgi:hypothetical protein